MPRLREAHETRRRTLAYLARIVSSFPSTSNSPGYGESSFRIKGFTSYIHTTGPHRSHVNAVMKMDMRKHRDDLETLEQNLLSHLTAHRSDYWPLLCRNNRQLSGERSAHTRSALRAGALIALLPFFSLIVSRHHFKNLGFSD